MKWFRLSLREAFKLEVTLNGEGERDSILVLR